MRSPVRQTSRWSLPTIAFLAVWSLAPAAAGQTTQTGVVTARNALSTIHIDNFGRVNEQYYRGAQPNGEDYADLAGLGVRTLINLTSDDAQANERGLAESAGMSYVQIPMTTHERLTPEKVTEFLRIVNDPARQPVYVHCVGGRHRTGVMSAVYRMTHDAWTADEAFKEMKRYKFGADFLHPEFKSFVYGYHVDGAHPVDTRAVAAAAPKSGS
jgi:tyrosine-protein phosphatase SIW14